MVTIFTPGVSLYIVKIHTNVLIFVVMTFNDQSMRISSKKKLLTNETAVFFLKKQNKKNIGNYIPLWASSVKVKELGS